MLPMIEYEHALFLEQNLCAHSIKPMLAWGRTYVRMGKNLCIRFGNLIEKDYFLLRKWSFPT